MALFTLGRLNRQSAI